MSSKTDVSIAPPATPAKKSKLRRVIILTGLALAVIAIGALIYLNSGSFRETVRQGGTGIVYLEPFHASF
jgi:hypothetical protein